MFFLTVVGLLFTIFIYKLEASLSFKFSSNFKVLGFKVEWLSPFLFGVYLGDIYTVEVFYVVKGLSIECFLNYTLNAACLGVVFNGLKYLSIDGGTSNK